jgi:hypothetical protein
VVLRRPANRAILSARFSHASEMMAKAKEFRRQSRRSEVEKEATRLATLMGSSIGQAGQTHQFQDRGFSQRTIKVLAKSVDAPERLLFMMEHEIEKIPGIGEASVREIRLYRKKFLPGEP